MKKLSMIMPLAMILCFMVGCQDKAAMAELEEFRAQAEVEEQNKEVVKRYFELMDEGNYALLDLLSEDYVAHFPGGIVFKGPEEIKQVVDAYLTAFPDISHCTSSNDSDTRPDFLSDGFAFS